MISTLRAFIRLGYICLIIISCYFATMCLQIFVRTYAFCGKHIFFLKPFYCPKRWSIRIQHMQLAYIRFYSWIFCQAMNVKIKVYRYDCNKSYLDENNLTPSSRKELLQYFPSHKNTSNKKVLVQSNHVSFLDVLLIGSVANVSFLAKQEVQSWPILGRMIGWAGIHFVNRNSVYSRIRALMKMKSSLQTMPFCLFPEGTTTDSTIPVYGKWKSGNIWAMNKKQPLSYHSFTIIPMSICYQDTKDNAWIGETTFVQLLYRIVKRSHTSVKVIWSTIDPAQIPSAYLRQQSLYIFSRITAQCLAGHKAYQDERL
ncbi:MAG: 1-acyl-sn-glycerol-3-phosphate acyltransferase [Proteobacteria bacterium]|nr:1-acyl-sn-glycerol-3-phosphate acyltransferase [Pseudomonadota bacterium]